jgi:hypothetical protein
VKREIIVRNREYKKIKKKVKQRKRRRKEGKYGGRE